MLEGSVLRPVHIPSGIFSTVILQIHVIQLTRQQKIQNFYDI